MNPNPTPRDVGRSLAEKQVRESPQLREAGEQAKASGVVRPEDIACLTKLIRALQEVSGGSREAERMALQFVTETRRRLEEIAAVSAPDDPIREILKRWARFFHLDKEAGDRPRLGDLLRGRIPEAIALARQTRSLLRWKRPKQVNDDKKAMIDRLGTLEGRLNSAVTWSVLDSARKRDIRILVSKIWRQLREVAAAEGEDPAFKELLALWQGLYQFDESHHMQVEVRELVREKGDVALALARETKAFLGSRRPNGA